MHGRTYEDGRQAVSEELRAGSTEDLGPDLKTGPPGHNLHGLLVPPRGVGNYSEIIL
ncbi:MAG: hypothetical protein ACYDEQ_09630 [Desulfocucumaceae bacterium]